MSPRLWHHRIQDILQAATKINDYTSGMSFKRFKDDSKTVDAVIRNFIIIGEAASRIPSAVKEANPGLPWRLMADMRNFAVHEYWAVELETVWKTIQEELPPLIPLLESILNGQE